MITYKDAGVDVHAGYEAVRLMKEHVKKTLNDNVLTDLGGFGGIYRLDGLGSEPALVAGTDGVGTKLKLAFVMDKHDTVGIDCVAMCVNDVACQGARPLLFLDYLATGKLEPAKAADIVKGVAEGCREAHCALIGGETAEMPGFYPEGEYDLAGFAVGLVDVPRAITGKNIREGDVLVGIASTGVHSNGFSLVRKLMMKEDKDLFIKVDELGCTVGEALLTPTRIYVDAVTAMMAAAEVKGLAHITGGGFIENIPRMIPAGLSPRIRKGSWDILPIFDVLKKAGNLTEDVLYNTFNMGIGMVAAVAPQNVDAVRGALDAIEIKNYIIGDVVAGGGDVAWA